VNVNGGAIAMGHPLGCTGAKLSVQLFDEMKRRGDKYGIVTMCVGTGREMNNVKKRKSRAKINKINYTQL
jgi:acetyl-CoA acetyltransferase